MSGRREVSGGRGCGRGAVMCGRRGVIGGGRDESWHYHVSETILPTPERERERERERENK